jgi:hypothetical protein
MLEEPGSPVLAVAAKILAPIHFGGNTSYEGRALGVLIVTLPSQFMRGRLTYAMYRQMGLLDPVAADATDYVRLAVRLGTEPDYRELMRRRITDRVGFFMRAWRWLVSWSSSCSPQPAVEKPTERSSIAKNHFDNRSLALYSPSGLLPRQEGCAH